MKQITLRSIPDEIGTTVQREAESKGLSLNKTIILLLEQALCRKAPFKKRAHYHDLDQFAGLWSREDAIKFDKRLNAQRKVDAELWKKLR